MTYPYVAGAVLLASDLNTDFAAKSDTAPAINAQTGTTYTFVLADATAGKTVTASNAAASTYTVPPQSSVTFVAGALLRVTNLGAGVVTFAGGVGVTVTNTAATLAQYQTATLVRTASDAWTVITAGGASGLTLVATATASASSAVSINTCFTAAYDRYLVTLQLEASTNGTDLQMRFRNGGSDRTSGYYAGMYNVTSAGASAVSGYSNNAAQITILSPMGTPASNVAQLTFMGVGSSAMPVVLWQGSSGLYSNTRYSHFGGGSRNATEANDGFSVYPAAGTITGRISVFAYSK